MSTTSTKSSSKRGQSVPVNPEDRQIVAIQQRKAFHGKTLDQLTHVMNTSIRIAQQFISSRSSMSSGSSMSSNLTGSTLRTIERTLCAGRCAPLQCPIAQINGGKAQPNWYKAEYKRAKQKNRPADYRWEPIRLLTLTSMAPSKVLKLQWNLQNLNVQQQQ